MQPGTLIPGLGLAALALIPGPATAPAASPFKKVVVPLGGAPQRVVIGDVDGDTDPDLVALSASTAGAALTVLLNDGRGGVSPGWSTALPALTLETTTDLELGDLDADGDLDLVVSLPFAESSARLNAGDGTFGPALPHGTGWPRLQNELAHLDADSYPDIAYYEIDAIPYVGSSKGDGDGTFTPHILSETRGLPSDLFGRTALGDVTGDGLEDLVLAAQSGLVFVPGIPGASIQAWGSPVTLDGGDYDDAAIADLDGDGGLEIVATKPGSNAVVVLLGPGSGKTFFPAGLKPLAICVADLNADTTPDVVVTSGRSGTVEILIGAGGGALLAPASVPAARDPQDVAAADLDADGDVDLAVTDTKLGGRVVLLFNKLVP